MAFDTERFILEIQNREALWKQSSNDYSNKNLKRELWLELTNTFGGDKLAEKEKGELGLNLQKKWKNIRDTFVRELRRRKGAKSGSAAKRKSSYVFFDLLTFLLPTLQINETNISLAETTPQELDNEINESFDKFSNEKFRKKKKKTDNEDHFSQELGNLTAALQESIKARQDENIQDYDKMFILSLLSGYKKIPDQLKSKAQIELIQVIEKYKSHSSIHPHVTRYGFPNTSFEQSQGHSGYYAQSGMENYSHLNSSTSGCSRSVYPSQERPHRPSSSYSTASSDLTFPHSNESEASDIIELFPKD